MSTFESRPKGPLDRAQELMTSAQGKLERGHPIGAFQEIFEAGQLMTGHVSVGDPRFVQFLLAQEKIIGELAGTKGDPAAIKDLREVLSRSLGPNDPSTAEALADELTAIEAAFTSARAPEQPFDPEVEELGEPSNQSIARCEALKEHFKESREAAESILTTIQDQESPSQDMRYAALSLRLGKALLSICDQDEDSAAQNREEAQSHLAWACDIFEELYGPAGSDVALAYSLLGDCSLQNRNLVDAERYWMRALSTYEDTVDRTAPELLKIYMCLIGLSEDGPERWGQRFQGYRILTASKEDQVQAKAADDAEKMRDHARNYFLSESLGETPEMQATFNTMARTRNDFKFKTPEQLIEIVRSGLVGEFGMELSPARFQSTDDFYFAGTFYKHGRRVVILFECTLLHEAEGVIKVNVASGPSEGAMNPPEGGITTSSIDDITDFCRRVQVEGVG